MKPEKSWKKWFSGFTKHMVLLLHGETAGLRENSISVSQNQRSTQRSRSARLWRSHFRMSDGTLDIWKNLCHQVCPKTKGYPDDTYHLQTLWTAKIHVWQQGSQGREPDCEYQPALDTSNRAGKGESTCLQDAVNAYYERTGYYPERVLADQIYRTRDNRAFCQKHGIRLSGPKLGRPSKETTKTDKQIEYQDNTDRIEVERRFSLTKRCYGMGKIVTRLEDTQLTSIALSVFVANIVRMQQRILSALFYIFSIIAT